MVSFFFRSLDASASVFFLVSVFLTSPPAFFAAILACAAFLRSAFTLSAYDCFTSAEPRSFVGCCSLSERALVEPMSFLSLYSPTGAVLPPPTAFTLGLTPGFLRDSVSRLGSLRPPSPVCLI